MSDPKIKAEDELETFVKRRGLVLVSELARWRGENGESEAVPFYESLLRNYNIIREDAWLDAIVEESGGLRVLALPLHPRLPEIAGSTEAKKLRTMVPAVILQDSPFLVVATMDPFAVAKIEEALLRVFPGRHVQIVLISPHSFSTTAALVERGACTFNNDWCEDLVEWAPLLGQSSENYLDLEMLIDEIWATSAPVAFPGQYNEGEKLTGLDAIVVRRTPLNAWVVTPRPTGKDLATAMMQALGRRIQTIAVGPREFARIVASVEAASKQETTIKRDKPLQVSDWGLANTDEVMLARNIVKAAIDMGASDIHLEPKQKSARLRFRIDGVLYEQAPLPLGMYQMVLRRLKIMASMLHEKSGILQDGAGMVEFNKVRYDLRFSISVVNGGEEGMTVRIFNSMIPDIADLGLKENEMKVLMWFLGQQNGMCICSGPTGSGKTTLLYGLLKALDHPSRSLVTIEQPVEKYFTNARQITVTKDGDITFASALRAVLRQDPDVIMVGEIRDKDSALVAVEAAQTGHLVLSTTHANSAAGVIERLCGSFPVDNVSLGNALRLSIAQRLVGRLCPFCKKLRATKSSDLEFLPACPIEHPVVGERVGCSVCRGTGISGRHLIMELMPVDDAVRNMIADKDTMVTIEQYNRSRGFRGLVDQATELLLTGEITLESARQFITRPLA